MTGFKDPVVAAGQLSSCLYIRVWWASVIVETMVPATNDEISGSLVEGIRVEKITSRTGLSAIVHTHQSCPNCLLTRPRLATYKSCPLPLS
jgi:hypothetical protein